MAPPPDPSANQPSDPAQNSQTSSRQTIPSRTSARQTTPSQTSSRQTTPSQTTPSQIAPTPAASGPVAATITPGPVTPAQITPSPVAPPRIGPTPAEPVPTTADPQRAAMLFARGLDAERRGDISGARRFYATSARQGDAAAALNLGRLYDPTYLKQTALGGVDPNPELARFWYDAAAKLGDTGAAPLLEALSSR